MSGPSLNVRSSESPRVPHPHGVFTPGCRRQIFSVRAELHAPHFLTMLAGDASRPSRGEPLPSQMRMVRPCPQSRAAPRQHSRPSRGKTTVSAEVQNLLTGLRIPDLYGLVLAATGEKASAVTAEGQTRNQTRVPGQALAQV